MAKKKETQEIQAVLEERTNARKEYKKKAERATNKFMKSARAFLASKLTGNPKGEIPEEFELSLMLLESYYKTFIMLDLEINDMDSVVIEGKYGPQPSPILTIRDRSCVRLESLLKSMGMTLKSGQQLGATEVKKQESPLDVFLKSQTEKEIEIR